MQPQRAGDRAEQRALAGAVVAEHGDDPALGHGERDPAQRSHAAVGRVHIADLKQGRANRCGAVLRGRHPPLRHRRARAVWHRRLSSAATRSDLLSTSTYPRAARLQRADAQRSQHLTGARARVTVAPAVRRHGVPSDVAARDGMFAAVAAPAPISRRARLSVEAAGALGAQAHGRRSGRAATAAPAEDAGDQPEGRRNHLPDSGEDGADYPHRFGAQKLLLRAPRPHAHQNPGARYPYLHEGAALE